MTARTVSLPPCRLFSGLILIKLCCAILACISPDQASNVRLNESRRQRFRDLPRNPSCRFARRSFGLSASGSLSTTANLSETDNRQKCDQDCNSGQGQCGRSKNDRYKLWASDTEFHMPSVQKDAQGNYHQERQQNRGYRTARQTTAFPRMWTFWVAYTRQGAADTLYGVPTALATLLEGEAVGPVRG